MRTVGLGKASFAIASAGLAVWSLTYAHFAWQALPAWMPWREAWVYGSALVVLAASAGLFFARAALPSALTLGVYQAVSAAIFVPQMLATPLSVGAWYPICEALTSLAGAWILYALLQRQLRGAVTPIAGEGAVRTAQVLFGLTCVFYGWSHFLYADYTAGMVPTWLPSHLAFAYFTGLGHIAAGLAIIIGIVPRLAATLETVMMTLFGLLVWVPSFFAQPPPRWATPPDHQWSELAVNMMLAASAWIVAISLENRAGYRAHASSKKLTIR
jgi:uncharacterized membrane protein YphA (DoxX/SURF4 family)